MWPLRCILVGNHRRTPNSKLILTSNFNNKPQTTLKDSVWGLFTFSCSLPSPGILLKQKIIDSRLKDLKLNPKSKTHFNAHDFNNGPNIKKKTQLNIKSFISFHCLVRTFLVLRRLGIRPTRTQEADVVSVSLKHWLLEAGEDLVRIAGSAQLSSACAALHSRSNWRRNLQLPGSERAERGREDFLYLWPG